MCKGHYYLIDGHQSRARWRLHADNLEGLKPWLKRHFNRDSKETHLDVVRLNQDGSVSSFGWRFFRDMTYKPF